MENNKIEIKSGIQELLIKLTEVRDIFNREFKATPENEFIQQTEVNFAAHLADLTDDVTALAGYNIRMNLNL